MLLYAFCLMRLAWMRMCKDLWYVPVVVTRNFSCVGPCLGKGWLETHTYIEKQEFLNTILYKTKLLKQKSK